ncbi:MAG: hypothetical protein EPO24_04330 [Bacteroidetes bacterium]|nr:MAG: hypothetical protein EPO24_04330 [Bacteroidota bacterium]
MTQTLIELTDEQMSALENLASERHISPSEIIQQELERLLRKKATKIDSKMKERALSVAGRFKSGIHDLAAHHDEYLVESLQ